MNAICKNNKSCLSLINMLNISFKFLKPKIELASQNNDPNIHGSCFFEMLPVWNSLTVWSESSRWVVFTIYRETQGALLFKKDGIDFPWDIPPSTSGRFWCEIRVKYDLFLPNNPYLVFFKRLWRIFTGKFDKIFTWKRVKVVNFGLERRSQSRNRGSR